MDIKLPELELKILSHLWELNNRATVQEVLDNWREEKIPRYTTVLKKLQIMEKKGVVSHEKEGKAYRYIPLVTKQEVSGRSIKDLIKNIFAGNRMELMHAFLDDTELSIEEISRIKKMLAEKEEQL